MRVTRTFGFEAAHHLPGYDGKCARVHGHSYMLHVTVDAPVGDDGLAMDFVDIKRIVEERVIDRLDHRDLNEIIEQPSAENIAIWSWNELGELPLTEIRVQETPSCWVTYNGPEREPSS